MYSLMFDICNVGNNIPPIVHSREFPFEMSDGWFLHCILNPDVVGYKSPHYTSYEG